MRAQGDERIGRVDRRRLLAEAGVALLPAAALLVVAGLGPGGAEGRFRGALAGLVVIAAVGAFGTGAGTASALRTALGRVAPAAALGALAYGLRGVVADGGSGGLDVLVLYAGVGAGACGLAAVGRAMRTPAVAAGAVAACVLWTAMAGLFWADPVAEHVDRTRRRPLRQAVLHVDPALALAYGAVGYDRLRSEAVYFEVPLASSLYERPGALSTGTTWLLTGLAAWATALLLVRRRDRSAEGGRAGGADRGAPRAADAAPTGDAAPAP